MSTVKLHYHNHMRWFVNRLSAYTRLMRLDKPIGIWLLMWPCWWSITLASDSLRFDLLGIFLIGAVVMRSAGCIINDMADRKIDAQIARTASRPLASGEVSMWEAVALLIGLLLIALGIAWYLGEKILWLSLLWLPLVIMYPFMKRITWWPQLFLGITFNAGALFGWVAVSGEISVAALVLYLGAVFWTLGYDTVYGHQDKKDDVIVGVKSTALKFGDKSKSYLFIFYGFFFLGIAVAMWLVQMPILAFLVLILPVVFLFSSLLKIDLDGPQTCLIHFKQHAFIGLLIWVIFLIFH